MDILGSSALWRCISSFINYLQKNNSWTLCGSAVLGLFALHRIKKSCDLPPGPRGWPLIGCTRLLARPFCEVLARLHRQYGDVVCLWLGGDTYWVILNGYRTIKEAYVERGADFMNRELHPVWDFVGYNDGIFMAPYNEEYKSKRKVCSHAFNSHGIARGRLDSILHTEWKQLSQVFDESPVGGTNPEIHYKRAMTNVICAVLYDKQLPHGDTDIDDMTHGVLHYFTSMLAAETIPMYPVWIDNVIQADKRAKAKENTERVIKLIGNIVAQHKQTFDPNNIRDFVDACLKQNIQNIEYVCLTLMTDAIYATTSVMMFIILYLLHHPGYQTRMRNEVKDAVRGNSNGITAQSKESMPFTEAFINEVFRIVSPFLTTITNKPLKSTTFRNYRIPSNFLIMANLHSIHHDPALYPDPFKFDPERFLDNGKLRTDIKVFPCGIGRRRCIGENLVRRQLFHYTANMVLRYEISSPDGQLPDITPRELSITRTNKPFKIVLTKL